MIRIIGVMKEKDVIWGYRIFNEAEERVYDVTCADFDRLVREWGPSGFTFNRSNGLFEMAENSFEKLPVLDHPRSLPDKQLLFILWGMDLAGRIRAYRTVDHLGEVRDLTPLQLAQSHLGIYNARIQLPDEGVKIIPRRGSFATFDHVHTAERLREYNSKFLWQSAIGGGPSFYVVDYLTASHKGKERLAVGVNTLGEIHLYRKGVKKRLIPAIALNEHFEINRTCPLRQEEVEHYLSLPLPNVPGGEGVFSYLAKCIAEYNHFYIAAIFNDQGELREARLSPSPDGRGWILRLLGNDREYHPHGVISDQTIAEQCYLHGVFGRPNQTESLRNPGKGDFKSARR